MAGLVAAWAMIAGGLAAAPAQAAKLVTIKGAQAERYGRIALTFDAPVPVTARIVGSVLVVSYGERSPSGAERIAAEMPDYVAAARRDPDGTGMRLGLQRPLRVNVQTAGERVFIDLLPLDWSGLPPPLPPEVVAELVRRATAAEAALKAKAPPVEIRTVALELALSPALSRLSLRLPASATARFDEAGLATRLTIPGPWRIDETAARGRTKPAIDSLAIEGDGEGARLLVTPAAGYEARPARDEDGITIDVSPKAPDPDGKAAEATAGPVEAAAAKLAEIEASETKSAATKSAAAKPSEMKPSEMKASEMKASEMMAKPARPPAMAQAPREAVIRPAGPGLVFPFVRMPPAALFERAGIATLVFETAEPVALPSGALPLSPFGEPIRVGGFTALRFRVPSARLLDLVPAGDSAAPTGWELVVGESLAASDALSVIRAPEANGRIGVGIRLPRPGGAVWLDLDGERVAVVTGRGPKPAGIPKRQAFVDFELLPSRQGVAALALADDLLVRPDIDGVSIAREGGMAVSGIAPPAEAPVAPIGDLVVERGAWEASRRGDVRETLRDQFRGVVDAPRPARGPLRLAYARSLLANGLAAEALGAATVAAAEDPVVAGQREAPILSAIANARLGRYADARRNLDGDLHKTDPEARLWQGYLDAQTERWPAADAAFRAAGAVLDRYPDDLQTMLRAAAAEAAIEVGDWEAAGRQITTASARFPDALTRDRLALLRARIDEVTGQTAAALDSYERLSGAGQRPVAAEATLRAAALGHAAGKASVAEAIERLEGLGLGWHGGPIEAKAATELARLYMEAGKWRQAFLTTRKAEGLAPDAPFARELHQAAQDVFDALYLGDRGAALSGVEALALYFDFKDFAPIGRRGDEIVRRLADRLVELDLLDSAGELLQHQVDHRVTGAARASVAARLATIRLMDEKPLMALQVLDATYLPELGGDLRRARALLRARALSDLSRTDLALETIEGEPGMDAQRLRADILWTGRRWRDAGEAHEAMVGEAWRSKAPLDDAARADIIRAAIAYGLAGEALALERLRAKFAGSMAESADARTFALLAQAGAVRTQGFREIAQRAASAETLQAFLKEYRKKYPDSAAPDRAARADAQGAQPPG